MARFDFRLPDVGEGVHEAEILAYHVAVGARVREHEPLLDVMTDKASVTLSAPRDGVVVALPAEVGAVVRVGAVVAVLEVEEVHAEVEASAVGTLEHALPGTDFFKRAPVAEAGVLAAPRTRGLARELGVDLARVRGTGPAGRVEPHDVRARADHPVSTPGRAEGPPIPVQVTGARVPVRGVRRAIAERMGRAVTTAAHFTFVEECDFGALLALRSRLAGAFGGARLTLVPFFARALAEVLPSHPQLHAVYDEAANELVLADRLHLGLATATDAGLLVPVLRDAAVGDLASLGARVDALAARARSGGLVPDELRGSTFTLTSLGKQAGYFATPILNVPEVAILGVHRVRERPVVREGRIEVGQVALVSLTSDHRFVDGHVAAAFLYDLLARLEAPEGLLRDGERTLLDALAE